MSGYSRGTKLGITNTEVLRNYEPRKDYTGRNALQYELSANSIESDSIGLLGSSFSLKFLELIDSWIRRFPPRREDRRLWKESYTSKTLFELRYERHKM